MPTPSRPISPDQPTRQQLDELDALMERMLALPVNQSGEFAGGQDGGTRVANAAAPLTGNARPESTFYVATTARTPAKMNTPREPGGVISTNSAMHATLNATATERRVTRCLSRFPLPGILPPYPPGGHVSADKFLGAT